MSFVLLLRPLSAVAAGDVVISQIYGGGGNSGAAYRNDFVELFNRGTNTISLSGWSVQYSAGSGASWQSVPLFGPLAAGQYFLAQLASGGANGPALPEPDALGNLNLGASAGKVALVSSTTLLAGECALGGSVVDFVGYGGGASCFEGAGPAAAPANATAAWRASNGCVDSDNNLSDFFVAAPAPRHRGSPLSACPSVLLPYALHAIQGPGTVSPLVGQLVTTTTNVITAMRDDGFFIQADDLAVDSDPNTSEAVFVSVPSGLPPAVAIGHAVVVTGIVGEFRPANDASRPPRTQLMNATVTLMASNQPLPTPVALTPADLSPAGAIEQLERFEAMRVRVDSLRVVGPTEGFIIETNAVGVSDGVFYGVLSGTPRPFREPGIPLLEALPPGAPAQVARFDLNPERLRVDSNAQPGARRLEVTAGAMVSNLVGVLDFEQGIHTLLPDASAPPLVSGNVASVRLPAAGSNEFTVGSFNLERFFDTADDAAVEDVVLTPTAFNGRLNKACLAIRQVLGLPDILGVEEMENLATLQALAAKVNGDAIADDLPDPAYQAWLEEGNDIGGIDVGFLVKSARVTARAVTQFGRTNQFINPLTGQPETLNDRPPLVLQALVSRPASPNPLPVTLILNHLRSMSGIDDPVDGPRVRAKRRAQAEYLANLIQERQLAGPGENLVVLGDFNAFEFNDGYVDVLGTIQGTPAPSNEVTLASADRVNPDLVNLTDELAAEERYSFSFEGNAQALDHILVNAAMRRRVNRYVYGRNNADFPESYRNNTNRSERVSDHDMPLAYFALAAPPAWLSIMRRADGTVALQLQGDPGQTNGVEASADLREWVEIGVTLANESGLASYLDTAPPPGRPRFYRVRTQLDPLRPSP